MYSVNSNNDIGRLIVKAFPGALILINQEGEIISFNNAAEKLFQYSEQEIVGQSIEVLIPAMFAFKHPECRNKYMKDPEVRAMGVGRDLCAQRKDKTEFPAEIGLNPLIFEDKQYVLAEVIDITQRKKQENEIKLRNKQLAELSDKLTKANDLLEIKNKDINESIEYAQKIQMSILPEKSLLKENIKDFSLFYRPKDIIGGDFYWFKKVGDVKYIAAIDCTGHGVPGAMLSVVVFSLLNEVIQEMPYVETGAQLSLLHSKLYHFLQQNKGENYSQDGCDISLCKIMGNGKPAIEYSGARQNLWLYNGSDLKVIKATKKSVGGNSLLGLAEPSRIFKTEKLQLRSGTLVGMVTDGIIDQLNINDKVFGYSNFQELLCANFDKQGHEIEKNIKSTIDLWIEDAGQLDDMLAIMFKV